MLNVLVCFLGLAGQAPPAPPAVANRRFGKLTFTWVLDPQKGAAYQGGVYIPAPPDEPYQTVDWRVVQGPQPTILDQNENAILVFPRSNGPIVMEVTVDAKPLDVRDKVKALEEKDAPSVDPDPVLWLRPTISVDSDATNFLRLAGTLRKKNPVKTVRSILEWMNAHFRKAGVFPLLPASQTLARGSGECAGNSMVFVGLCQAAGVPARVVQGLVCDAPSLSETGTITCHLWAEVWFGGIGWVQVEPQRPNSLGCLAANSWLSPYIKLEHWDPVLDPYLGQGHAAGRLTPASNLGIMAGSPAVTYRLLSRIGSAPEPVSPQSLPRSTSACEGQRLSAFPNSMRHTLKNEVVRPKLSGVC